MTGPVVTVPNPVDLEPILISNDSSIGMDHATANAVFEGIQPWDKRRFAFKCVLAPALRSGGQVELYQDMLLGSYAAVKRVPVEHCHESPEAFALHSPQETENPWIDAAMSLFLGAGPSPLRGVCSCLGVYQDARRDMLIASEYIAGGDLFSYAGSLGSLGDERETRVWPVVRSLMQAVLDLHALDIAHGDISLENALLLPARGLQEAQVVLIDFAMASVGDECRAMVGCRGKKSYQAPEMHQEGVPYDARAADLFACGVSAYCLAVGSYPWASTFPATCGTFAFASTHGFKAFFEKRRTMARGIRGPMVSECLSPAFRKLLSALLSVHPIERYDGPDLLAFPETVPFLDALVGG